MGPSLKPKDILAFSQKSNELKGATVEMNDQITLAYLCYEVVTTKNALVVTKPF